MSEGLAPSILDSPRTSDPHPDHRIYPYLLRGLEIDQANQVWCTDITVRRENGPPDRFLVLLTPMRRGFLYLVAIMGWASRKVLAWRLSNTMYGKGRWMDNVFIERLWRSLKYECVYLQAFETGAQARAGIGR